MEIGTEISKKIRAAIKGKLQELGAYVDEELPDYIMVMVANKKNAQQMAEDLSLFLGNNTLKFTVWLHGVLEKLRSVAVEPASLKPQHATEPSDSTVRLRVPSTDDRIGDDLHGLDVSSSHSDSREARVSTSFVHEHQMSKGRLTSTVKPLVELQSAEAVIDIKPEPDDDLITEEVAEGGARTSRSGLPVTHASGRPSIELYRPPQAGRLPVAPARNPVRAQESLYGYRPIEQNSNRSEHQDIRSSRVSLAQTGGSQAQDECSRKRKAPMASSIIRVSRAEGQDSDELEEEEDEEDEAYAARSRGVSSRVSLPSKPERRPSLPPAKQANKNLILKAISEAQESISRTTNYTSAPQRQMVPVAPRTRSDSHERSPAFQHAPDELQNTAPQRQAQVPSESHSARRPVPVRSLSSRLQMDVPEQGSRGQQAFVVSEVGGVKSSDTRSFIVRRRDTEQPNSIESRLGSVLEDTVTSSPRTVQASRDQTETPASGSPKFIVTLDGVPSPLADMMESEPDIGDKANSQLDKWPKPSVHERLQQPELPYSDEEEQLEEDTGILAKRQKIMERCRFWPVCKSGDDCMYHHPTAQCKTFPNCKFGDKCLFVHPNCKYDAKCTKADCPFTHVSKRGAAPPTRPDQQISNSTCRFFPECKKVDCTFYHPKACRFATQCKRAGCPFYHPAPTVPPRHALKWTKASNS